MIEDRAFAHHGGAVAAARRAFPGAPDPWVDLSTGINPHAYPVDAAAPADWARLPDADGLERLDRAARAAYRAPAGSEVVAAPGTQAIIQRLPALLGGRDVRILGRTYGEFAAAFANVAEVRVVETPEALVGAEVAILVNPNNPDGRLLPAGALRDLAERVGTLVVDEAFVDALDPAASVVPQAAGARMVVLRSFGKIYGLAGLRLGFAILPPDLGAPLRAMLGPWAVSGPALAIGARALADEPWLAAMRVRLAGDGRRLADLLRPVGAEPVGETPLFRLVAHEAGPALFAALARDGILVRPFAGAPRLLRFGLPGPEAEWRRLGASLRGFAG